LSQPKISSMGFRLLVKTVDPRYQRANQPAGIMLSELARSIGFTLHPGRQSGVAPNGIGLHPVLAVRQVD